MKHLFRWIYNEYKNKLQYDENGRQLTYDQIFTGFTYQMDQDKINEPEIITPDQAELIAESSNINLGTLIMVGFDSGFRPVLIRILIRIFNKFHSLCSFSNSSCVWVITCSAVERQAK